MKRFNSPTISSGPAFAQAGPTPSVNPDGQQSGQIQVDSGLPRIPRLRYRNQSAQERRPALAVPSALGSGRNPLPFWKQSVDCLGCLVGLPLLAMGTVAWSVVASYSSPGPVLYKQERVGYMGRRFWIYKFRTMRVGAPRQTDGNSSAGVAPTDALVVRAKSRRPAGQMPGATLLRSTAFDQLPQILNVWRGEMSFVGPRPYTPAELEKSVRWQRERYDTLPGITGLGQISQKNNLTPDESTRMDIRYVRGASLWLDVKILLGTLPLLLARIREADRANQHSVRSDDANVSTPAGGTTPTTAGQPSYN